MSWKKGECELQFKKFISFNFSINNNFLDGGQKFNKITDAILKMIAVDLQPFSMVEDEGFKNLMKTIAPKYKVPSRKTIQTLFSSTYKQQSSKIKNLIKYQKLCLTTDIWTDTLNTKSFLGLTAHFINKSTGEFVEALLGIILLSEAHTGDYIAFKLNELLEKWDILLENVIVVVTDNGANIVAAVDKLFGKAKHLPCFAHTLNLIAENSIFNNNIQLHTIIGKVKDIVSFFKRSVNAADKLRESQKNRSTPLKLIQSVSTRWNSVFDMLERFYELRVEISQVLMDNKKDFISNTELELVGSVLPILKMLKHVTVDFSGSTYATGCMIFYKFLYSFVNFI